MSIRHTAKETHDNGVELEKPIYWCDRVPQFPEWHFTGADHLAASVGGSIQPCKKCIKAIIKELKKEL